MPIIFKKDLCSEYTKTDLLKISKLQTPPISIPKGTSKDEICKILIDRKASTKGYKPRVKVFQSIETLMEYLDVDDARKLIKLTDDELEELIRKIKLYDENITMEEYLIGSKGSERVKRFLVAIAKKYCRCLKGVEAKGNTISPNAICNQSIFNNKGLKAPGASYQCTPTPLLLAPIGSKYVLERSTI
jgi:hypothetical protein